MKAANEGTLSKEWMSLVKEAMESSKTKEEFKAFLEAKLKKVKS